MLSEQWYMAMSKPAPEGSLYPGKSIAEVGLDAVESGEVNIFPAEWRGVYISGSKIFKTGASLVSSGGVIRSLPGMTKLAESMLHVQKKKRRNRQAKV